MGNLLTNSEYFDQSPWTVDHSCTLSSAGVTPPTECEIAYDYFVTTVAGGATWGLSGPVILSRNTTYTFSFWAKSNTGLSAYLNIYNGSGYSIATFNLTSSWQRFSYTLTTGSYGSDAGVLNIRTPNGDDSIYIAGAQVEQSASMGTYDPQPPHANNDVAGGPVSFDVTAAISVTCNDTGPNDLDGLYYGGFNAGPSIVPGVVGKTAIFNGSSGYAEIPYNSALNPANNFSVETWVIPTRIDGTWQTIVQARDGSGSNKYGWTIQINPSNQFNAAVSDGSTSWSTVVSGTVVQGQRYHLIFTVNSTGVLTFYVDGSSQGTAGSAFACNTSKPMRVGAGTTAGAPTQFFQGTIDEVRLYSKALDATEVGNLLSKGLTAGSDYDSYSGTLGEIAEYPMGAGAWRFVVAGLPDAQSGTATASSGQQITVIAPAHALGGTVTASAAVQFEPIAGGAVSLAATASASSPEAIVVVNTTAALDMTVSSSGTAAVVDQLGSSALNTNVTTESSAAVILDGQGQLSSTVTADSPDGIYVSEGGATTLVGTCNIDIILQVMPGPEALALAGTATGEDSAATVWVYGTSDLSSTVTSTGDAYTIVMDIEGGQVTLGGTVDATSACAVIVTTAGPLSGTASNTVTLTVITFPLPVHYLGDTTIAGSAAVVVDGGLAMDSTVQTDVEIAVPAGRVTCAFAIDTTATGDFVLGCTCYFRVAVSFSVPVIRYVVPTLWKQPGQVITTINPTVKTYMPLAIQGWAITTAQIQDGENGVCDLPGLTTCSDITATPICWAVVKLDAAVSNDATVRVWSTGNASFAGDTDATMRVTCVEDSVACDIVSTVTAGMSQPSYVTAGGYLPLTNSLQISPPTATYVVPGASNLSSVVSFNPTAAWRYVSSADTLDLAGEASYTEWFILVINNILLADGIYIEPCLDGESASVEPPFDGEEAEILSPMDGKDVGITPAMDGETVDIVEWQVPGQT